jgi:NhaP-type Na+/H+ or K+/H+ antiporter
MVTLALIGIVIIVASLLSGLVERSGVPQVGVFLLLGLAIGPMGLALLDFPLNSPTLHAIATLALLLVLFSDAISVSVAEVRRRRRLTVLVLGPGTIIPAAGLALAAWWLLALRPAAAAILGAALASTDPVLLRGLLRHPDLPPRAGLALRLESDMNDAVLLPIVVVGILFLGSGAAGATHVATSDILRHAVGLFLLGPALGAMVGWVAITALDRVRARTGVRRDYESLYALGVALTAFAAAEAVGGSGFLAAFAAGIVIASMDVELCDCFLDYGQATAEMFLLLTFLAFGTSLIWSGLAIINGRTLAFAAIALVLRAVVLFPMLRFAELDDRSRRLVAWFGPRGLSTLLLALLPVFDGVTGSGQLFQVASLVVLLSLLLHGGGIALFMRRAAWARSAQASANSAPPAAATSTAPASEASAPPDASASVSADSASVGVSTPDPERVTVDELRQMWASHTPVVVLDARTERAYAQDERRARGAVRISPDNAVSDAERLELPRNAPLVAFCA